MNSTILDLKKQVKQWQEAAMNQRNQNVPVSTGPSTARVFIVVLPIFAAIVYQATEKGYLPRRLK